MSVYEFNMWMAYFTLQQEEKVRQDRLAKAKR